MTFDSLKISVAQAIRHYDFDSLDKTENTINKIILGALLFKHISNLIDNNKKLYSDDIKDTAINYASTYYNIVKSLKGKYISYKQLVKTIKGFNVSNFLQLTSTQINTIYNIYCNKAEIKQFSTNSYSQFMYNVYRITDNQNRYLEQIHRTIIIPLVKYYKQSYDVQDYDVVVDNINENYPGKAIKISISKIPCSQIYNDLERDIFNIGDRVYSFDMTPDGFIEIIFK